MVNAINQRREVADAWLHELEIGRQVPGHLERLHLSPETLPVLRAAELLHTDEWRKRLLTNTDLIMVSLSSFGDIQHRIKSVSEVNIGRAPLDIGWAFYPRKLPQFSERWLETSLRPMRPKLEDRWREDGVNTLFWAKGRTTTLVEIGRFYKRYTSLGLNASNEPVPGTYHSLYTAQINNQSRLIPGQHRHVLSLLVATWHQARSPITVHGNMGPPSVSANNYEESGSNADLKASTVVLKNLRPSKSRAIADNNSDAGRTYDHRWRVQGHWRDQRVGPGLRDQRKVWVREHARGPQGGELVEKHHVWRL